MGAFFSSMFSPRNHQDLHNAVKRADLKAIKYLIKHGYDVDSINVFGHTPLRLAIESKSTVTPESHGNNCVINTLSNDNPASEKEKAKSHSFKSNQHPKTDLVTLQALLELGANPNLRNVGKVKLKPALFHAIDACKPEAVHILLNNQADVTLTYSGQNALEYIFKKQKPGHMLQKQFLKIKEQIVILLLGHCDLSAISVDYPQVMLCHAVWTGSTKIVSAVLENISTDDINTPTISGNLAMCSAIANGQADIVFLLTEKGADLKRITHPGTYPLSMLVGNLHVNIWDKLGILHEFLDKGGDVEAWNFSERLTEMALVGGHTDLLQKMADCGVDLSVGPPRESALSFLLNNKSCRSKHSLNKKWKLVQILIRSGADIFEKNKDGHPIICDILHFLESVNHENIDTMEKELKVYILHIEEMKMNLQYMCRKIIREDLGSKCTRFHISTLPIPTSLQDFLLFSDCPATSWNV